MTGRFIYLVGLEGVMVFERMSGRVKAGLAGLVLAGSSLLGGCASKNLIESLPPEYSANYLYNAGVLTEAEYSELSKRETTMICTGCLRKYVEFASPYVKRLHEGKTNAQHPSYSLTSDEKGNKVIIIQ